MDNKQMYSTAFTASCLFNGVTALILAVMGFLTTTLLVNYISVAFVIFCGINILALGSFERNDYDPIKIPFMILLLAYVSTLPCRMVFSVLSIIFGGRE